MPLPDDLQILFAQIDISRFEADQGQKLSADALFRAGQVLYQKSDYNTALPPLLAAAKRGHMLAWLYIGQMLYYRRSKQIQAAYNEKRALQLSKACFSYLLEPTNSTQLTPSTITQCHYYLGSCYLVAKTPSSYLDLAETELAAAAEAGFTRAHYKLAKVTEAKHARLSGDASAAEQQVLTLQYLEHLYHCCMSRQSAPTEAPLTDAEVTAMAKAATRLLDSGTTAHVTTALSTTRSSEPGYDFFDDSDVEASSPVDHVLQRQLFYLFVLYQCDIIHWPIPENIDATRLPLHNPFLAVALDNVEDFVFDLLTDKKVQTTPCFLLTLQFLSTYAGISTELRNTFEALTLFHQNTTSRTRLALQIIQLIRTITIEHSTKTTIQQLLIIAAFFIDPGLYDGAYLELAWLAAHQAQNLPLTHQIPPKLLGNARSYCLKAARVLIGKFRVSGDFTFIDVQFTPSELFEYVLNNLDSLDASEVVALGKQLLHRPGCNQAALRCFVHAHTHGSSEPALMHTILDTAHSILRLTSRTYFLACDYTIRAVEEFKEQAIKYTDGKTYIKLMQTYACRINDYCLAFLTGCQLLIERGKLNALLQSIPAFTNVLYDIVKTCSLSLELEPDTCADEGFPNTETSRRAILGILDLCISVSTVKLDEQLSILTIALKGVITLHQCDIISETDKATIRSSYFRLIAALLTASASTPPSRSRRSSSSAITPSRDSPVLEFTKEYQHWHPAIFSRESPTRKAPLNESDLLSFLADESLLIYPDYTGALQAATADGAEFSPWKQQLTAATPADTTDVYGHQVKVAGGAR